MLFDWDNTLVDNWAVIRQAMNAALQAFGQEPWTLEEACQRIARSSRDGFPSLFGADWQAAQDIFYNEFTAAHLDTLVPLEGSQDVLKVLEKEGLWLAVVSNKRGDLLRAEAVHLGWDGYFNRIVGANDAVADKPAADVVELALKGSGMTCGTHIWFVGDGSIDIECARNAGCVAVLYNGYQKSDPDRVKQKPDYAVSSHRELAALVRTL